MKGVNKEVNYKEKIHNIISKLGITQKRASEIMDISYNVLRQKNSDKSPRHTWNKLNFDKIKEFEKKYEKLL